MIPRATTPPPGGRDAALDAGRGVLMLLGIFLHAANVYSPGARWLVADPVTSPFFAGLAAVIHGFRMPAFFLISGYFCAMVLLKRGARSLVSDRLLRIGVPLLVVWFALNPIHRYFIDDNRAGSFPPDLYHLWFLVDLLVFSVVAGGLRRVGLAIGQRAPAIHAMAPWLVVLLATTIAIVLSVASRATGVAYESIFGVTTLFRLSSGLAFFWFGMLVHDFPAVRDGCLRVPFWWVVPALAFPLFAMRFGVASGWRSELLHAAGLLAAAVASAGVLRLCYQSVRGTNWFTRTVSETSYSIYLLHHMIVVALAALLVPAQWPIGLKYIFVVAAVLATCLVVHYLVIDRSMLLRFLLNGKRPPKPAPRVSSA